MFRQLAVDARGGRVIVYLKPPPSESSQRFQPLKALERFLLCKVRYEDFLSSSASVRGVSIRYTDIIPDWGRKSLLLRPIKEEVDGCSRKFTSTTGFYVSNDSNSNCRRKSPTNCAKHRRDSTRLRHLSLFGRLSHGSRESHHGRGCRQGY